MKAFAILVAVVAASPAWSQNAPTITLPPSAVAPAAADRTLGAANMFAIVSTAGALRGGSGAVSSAPGIPGQYEVTFDRSVVGCGLTASAGEDQGSVAPILVLPYNWPGNANKVGVFTRNPSTLAALNGAFHLMVLCAK
jgi:hypothetical protein